MYKRQTLLTLVVIPIVYELVDRKPDAYYVERGARKARGVQADEDSSGTMDSGSLAGELSGARS